MEGKSDKPRKKDVNREEENTWDCAVCTYKNPAEAFKCLMCDVRKGTSTRKPRINPELVAQQVARQQQHLLLKISHGRAKDGNKEGNGKESSKVENDGNSRDVKDFKDDGTDSGTDSKKSTPNKQTKHKKSSNVDGTSPGPSSQSKTSSNKKRSSSSSRLKKSKKDIEVKSPSVAALLATTNSDTSSSSSSTSSLSSSTTTTTTSSSTKNGLSARLKTIDRNNCSSEAVTVNNVTVIITEFLSDLKK